MAENPTSSSTIYTTFGAPSGAFGGSNGAQSGTESRMSVLTVPLNGSLIAPPRHPPSPSCPSPFPTSHGQGAPWDQASAVGVGGGQAEQEAGRPLSAAPPFLPRTSWPNRPSSCDPSQAASSWPSGSPIRLPL